ncbi:MAG: hypothetical protein Q4A01_08570 [Coriobacteriales bacterium]|nr:hypothetical protein [Coriobacteriales bacterium]
MRHMSQLPPTRVPQQYATAKPVLITVLLTICALVSALVLSPHFSSADTYEDMFHKLDEKKSTVLTLSAASAATSAILTAIPDDTCTPIAERMSEISKDFTIVLAAILLEKYLVTTLGFVFFSGVVPLSCVLFAVAMYLRAGDHRRRMLMGAAGKFLLFGLVLFLSTPTSVFITSKIDETYATSIQQTVEAAQQTTEFLGQATEEAKRKDPENPLEFLQQRFEDLQSAAGNAVDNIAGVVDWVKQLLNNFLEAFAVMIVTSFVIPILVPLVIYLAFKILFGQQQIVVVEKSEPSQKPVDRAMTKGTVPRI